MAVPMEKAGEKDNGMLGRRSQPLLVTGFLWRPIHAARDAGTRVAMVFDHALES